MYSIEWLADQLKEYDFTPPSNNGEYVIIMPKWIFDAKRDEAEEMHKQEIIDAIGVGSQFDRDYLYGYHDKAEQYYQETFVSKGSGDTLKDYHIVDTNEMVELPQQDISDDQAIEMLKDMNKQPMRFHCVPKEISDEEILDAAAKCRFNDLDISVGSFELGARWYREQLKQRQNG